MSSFRGLRALVPLTVVAMLLVGMTGCGSEQQRRRNDHPRHHRPAGLASTRPAPTTCPPTTSSTTSTRTCSRSRPAATSRCRRRPKSCDFTERRRPTSARCKDGAQVLRRLAADGRGRRVLVRAQRRDRRPERRLVAAREHEEHRGAGRQDRSSSTSRSPTRPGRSAARRPARSRSSRPTSTRRTSSSRATRSSAPAATRSASYEPGQQTVLREERPSTTGDDPAKNDHGDHPVLRQGLGAEARGRAGRRRRRLPQPQPDRPRGPARAPTASTSSTATGTEIRYLVFNLDLQPGDNDAQKLAIRQAVAQTIDRQAIADNVYNGTVKPLYSMVPQGLQYATEAFKDEYGDAPDVDAAKADARRRRRRRRRCRSRSGGRRRTTAPPPATSTPRSSASSRTAACST